MLTFDGFLIGMEQFGQRIQPLMSSRQGIRTFGSPTDPLPFSRQEFRPP
jgi:hypothetical protein